ncbi:MAG: hypothetical protein ABNH16_05040 [Thalassolituus sp.]|jgi:hypothetical protein
MNELDISRSLPQNIVRIFKLYRPKVSAGILSVAHGGVCFEFDTGYTVVLHRTPENLTHLSSLEEFGAGQEVTKVVLPENTYESIMLRANATLQANVSYSVLFSNCEHLLNFVIHGKAESEQLRAAVIGLGVGYLLTNIVLKNQPPLLKGLAIAAGLAITINMAKKSKLQQSSQITW